MQHGPTPPILHKKQTSGETFCGADRGIYRWSQTMSDLDVVLAVSSEIKTGSNVRVETTSETIRIGVRKPDETDWTLLIDGKLSFKMKPAEIMWSLEPGKRISIHLEKMQERWWDSLLESEPKINLEEYELTRSMSDVSEEEEMTLQKLWSKQLKKKNGPEKTYSC